MRIAIIGLGLIGGSMGLALSRAGEEVVGFARHPHVALKAVEVGAVCRTTDSATAAARGADVVVIATPVMAVREIFPEIAGAVQRSAIVTDVASTKAMVMGWAREHLLRSTAFIGGHPMAGREASGIETADGDLFQGCVYCLVPGKGAARESITTMESLVQRIGAQPLIIDADEHDRLVAGISHLPLIASAALVGATTADPSWQRMARLASSGYRDVSRLASGDPRMGRDICMTNKENIAQWIDDYINELKKWRRLVARSDDDLERALEAARKAREGWLRK